MLEKRVGLQEHAGFLLLQAFLTLSREVAFCNDHNQHMPSTAGEGRNSCVKSKEEQNFLFCTAYAHPLKDLSSQKCSLKLEMPK